VISAHQCNNERMISFSFTDIPSVITLDVESDRAKFQVNFFSWKKTENINKDKKDYENCNYNYYIRDRI